MSMCLAVCGTVVVSHAEEAAAAAKEAPTAMEITQAGGAIIKGATGILKTVKDEATADAAAPEIDKLTAKSRELEKTAKEIKPPSEEEMEKLIAELPKLQADAMLFTAELARITEAKALSKKLDESTKQFVKALDLDDLLETEVEEDEEEIEVEE